MTTAQPAPATTVDNERLERAREVRERALGEIRKVIVGQEDLIDQVLIALFSGGHVLLVGVPGLAKTLLVSTLAQTLSMSYKRIQFTPDMMPSDITGTEILEEDHTTGRKAFAFVQGPVFTNLLLADEINRTPPKTQAALLEAMQERRVTTGGTEHILEAPFFVLATQNPLDQEGTYPLPEAQLDRFLFKINVGYPSADEELEVVRRVASPSMAESEKSIQKVMSAQQVIAVQKVIMRVPIADAVMEYATRLVRATRPRDETAPDFIKEWISWGAGPRASIALAMAAKARAAIHGKFAVDWEDIDAVAHSVLCHRIACSYQAAAEQVTTKDVVTKLLETVQKG